MFNFGIGTIGTINCLSKHYQWQDKKALKNLDVLATCKLRHEYLKGFSNILFLFLFYLRDQNQEARLSVLFQEKVKYLVVN